MDKNNNKKQNRQQQNGKTLKTTHTHTHTYLITWVTYSNSRYKHWEWLLQTHRQWSYKIKTTSYRYCYHKIMIPKRNVEYDSKSIQICQGKTEKKKNRRRKTELLTANQLPLPLTLAAGKTVSHRAVLEWNGSQQSPSTWSRERCRWVHQGYFLRSVNAEQVDRSSLGVTWGTDT